MISIKYCRAAALTLSLALLMTGCGSDSGAGEARGNDDIPFANAVDNYAAIDLETVATDIYTQIEIDPMLEGTVEDITDPVTIEEQFYVPMASVISYSVRSADGRYGVSDVYIFRVRTGHEDEVLEALELRKSDRIAEFADFDVNSSFDIALGADIYQEGELIVMLMLSPENKTKAREIITSYLPIE